MSSSISFMRAVFVLVTLLTLTTAQHVANSKCAKGVHLVVTSGYGGSPTGYGGILSELVADILDKIPHSTAVSVPFDKGNTADYRGSISGASTTMKKYVEQYVQSCPYGRVILLGYSSGAIAAMNTVCGTSMAGWTPTTALAPSFHKNIIATVVYGDESFTNNQPYNKGSCTAPAHKPRAKPGCQPFAKHIISYCDAHDVQCCPPDNGKDVHHKYDVRHNKEALSFIMSRHDATKKHPRYNNAIGHGHKQRMME